MMDNTPDNINLFAKIAVLEKENSLLMNEVSILQEEIKKCISKIAALEVRTDSNKEWLQRDYERIEKMFDYLLKLKGEKENG